MQQFVSPVYLGSTPVSLHKELKVKKLKQFCPVSSHRHSQKQQIHKCFFFFSFKSKGLPKHSVSGCIRNFKMNGAPMSNPTTNHGAGPCFEGPTQRGAYFSGNGAHVVISESIWSYCGGISVTFCQLMKLLIFQRVQHCSMFLDIQAYFTSLLFSYICLIEFDTNFINLGD